jgi:flagellar FliL protein
MGWVSRLEVVMADESEEDVEAAEAEEGAAKKRRFAGRTLILFIVMPVLLLGGGGAAMFVFDPLDLFSSDMSATAEDAAPKPVVFFEMPDMLVNLSSKDKRSQYLKLKVALEMTDKETRKAITPMLPRIMDIFQIYLRELRSEDLEGSAGVYRLKEELLRRINLVLNPRKIDRILFKEMIVQ